MPHVRAHYNLRPQVIDEFIAKGLLERGQPLDSTRDCVLVSSTANLEPVASLILRPTLYAHSLCCNLNMSRSHVDALFYFANGLAASRDIKTTLFHVGAKNDRMQKYISQQGAITEPNSLLYRYDI